jgi:hypothetical protein
VGGTPLWWRLSDAERADHGREPPEIAGSVCEDDVDQNTMGTSSGEPGWSWPPYAPWEPVEARFGTEEWAPASSVRHPWVRVGRWTLLYRRAA